MKEKIDEHIIFIEPQDLNQIQGKVVLEHCEVKFTERIVLMDNAKDHFGFFPVLDNFLSM